MSLYLQHFGLQEPPFTITPHTEFFFPGANRGALLEAVYYAALHEEGVIKISGAVGSGKTMLCRMLSEKLQTVADVIYLADPALPRHEILDAIAADLPPLADSVNTTADTLSSTPRLRVLQERLIQRYAQQRRVVLLIDEAHAMPPESLEEIRLLSNLESRRHKLLQIVLFGQEELDELLRQPAMRPLRDRITQSFRLGPLAANEVANYLSFRLGAAGAAVTQLFTPTAAKQIARFSRGLTRRINILADKALLAAFSEGCGNVLPRHVKLALSDLDFASDSPTTATRNGLWRGICIGLICGALAAWAFNLIPNLLR